jgi:hypothetical protein
MSCTSQLTINTSGRERCSYYPSRFTRFVNIGDDLSIRRTFTRLGGSDSTELAEVLTLPLFIPKPGRATLVRSPLYNLGASLHRSSGDACSLDIIQGGGTSRRDGLQPCKASKLDGRCKQRPSNAKNASESPDVVSSTSAREITIRKKMCVPVPLFACEIGT